MRFFSLSVNLINFFFILSLLLLSFFIEWNFTHNQQNLFSTWIFALQPTTTTTTTMIQAMFLCVYVYDIHFFLTFFFSFVEHHLGIELNFFSTLFFCFFDMILTICIKIKNKTLSLIYYNGKNLGNVCSHTHTGLYSSE